MNMGHETDVAYRSGEPRVIWIGQEHGLTSTLLEIRSEHILKHTDDAGKQWKELTSMMLT